MSAKRLVLGAGGFLGVLLGLGWWMWQSAGPTVTAMEEQRGQAVPGKKAESIEDRSNEVESERIEEEARKAALTPVVPDEADMRIDAVLRSAAPPEVMAREFGRLIPSLKPGGQVKAAAHMVNLTSDDLHGELVAYLIVRSDVDASAQVLLFQDLLNRPLNLQWPVYSAILSQSNHSLRSRVLAVLRGMSNRDHGDDAVAWLKEIELLSVGAGG